MRAISIRTKAALMQLPFLDEGKRLACTPQPGSGRSISYYFSGYVSYPVSMRGTLARKSNQTNTHSHISILLKRYGENASEASGLTLVHFTDRPHHFPVPIASSYTTRREAEPKRLPLLSCKQKCSPCKR